MKHEDERDRARGIEFETDDEENMAEGIGGIEEDDYHNNGYTSSSPSSYNTLPTPHSVPWPQSYRQSMDVYSSFTTPSVSFLGGSSLGIGSSIFSSSPTRRTQVYIPEPTLRKSLLASVDKEYHSFQTPKHSSFPRFSQLELPPIQQCSSTGAVLNGLNVLCGVGLLSTPFAVHEGGWTSLLVLLIYAAISCYTGILLKRCLESSPGLHTFPDIGQAAFGVSGRVVIAIILYIELYACCVEYIILMSDNLSSLFPNANMNFPGMHLNSHFVFAITATLVVLPTVWLRNLSLLSYLSAGGVISSLFVVMCLLWVGVVDRVGFHPHGTALDIVNLPVAIGLYGYCYSGHAVFPNIYSSMKDPAQFTKVLMISFLICFALYTGVAVCGFMMFGDNIKSQFTLNMPKDFMASKVAVWATIMNPLCKYALTMTPVALSLEELWPEDQLQSHLVPVFIRTMLVFSTLCVGLSLPFFSYVMALTGSFCTMLVSLIYPCACYLKIHRGRVDRLQIVICILIIIVGVLCSCLGSYSAIRKMVDKLGQRR